LVVCWGENSKQSRDILHSDGERRRTIFVMTKTVRDHLTFHKGWQDVTERWMRQLEEESAEEEAPEGDSPSRRPEPSRTASALSEEAPPQEESTEPDAAAAAAKLATRKSGTRRRKAS
jgi:hypothetical protein